jgi:hypothetical protein
LQEPRVSRSVRSGAWRFERDGANAAEGDWIVDTRLRYESVSQDGLEDADALTLRARLGYETRRGNGFKFIG